MNKHFVGANGTFAGTAMKIYSNFETVREITTADVRAKYGDVDDLESHPAFTFLHKIQQSLKSKKKLEVKSEVNVPFYIIKDAFSFFGSSRVGQNKQKHNSTPNSLK